MYRLKSLAFLSSLLQLSFVNGQMVPAVVTTTREAITRTVAVARVRHNPPYLFSHPVDMKRILIKKDRVAILSNPM